MTIQEQVHELIAVGKTKDALYRLSEELRGTEEGNTITLLQSRWANNHRSYSQGTLTHSEYAMENNRINHALLSVMSDLESLPSASLAKQKAEEVVQQIYNIHIGDVVHGDKVGGDKVGRDKVTNNQRETGDAPRQIAPEADLPEVQPKTILFIAANPNNTNQTEAGTESKMIQDAIDMGHLRDQYILKIFFASSIEDLIRLLQVHDPTIIHLSMHGSEEGILLQGEFGAAQELEPDYLAELFAILNERSKALECVILNACSSHEHAKALINYVNIAIGMNDDIPVEAGIKYTKYFYNSLLTGSNYPIAHKIAKTQLKFLSATIDYNGKKPIHEIPELFSA